MPDAEGRSLQLRHSDNPQIIAGPLTDADRYAAASAEAVDLRAQLATLAGQVETLTSAYTLLHAGAIAAADSLTGLLQYVDTADDLSPDQALSVQRAEALAEALRVSTAPADVLTPDDRHPIDVATSGLHVGGATNVQVLP